MNKLYLLATTLLLSLFTFAQEKELTSTYRPGELMVMLHGKASVQELIAQNPEAHLHTINRITPSMNLWLMGYDESAVDGEKAKAVLAASRLVQIVQFNHNNIELKSTPNDSDYSRQWDMDIISAPQAWSLDTGGFTTTGHPIVVASIDGGFEISHPDLNPWHNQNEIPGNGIDDDNNGYIDDYNGWNAVLINDSIVPGNGHGTATIGISSAVGNNSIGVTGVSWHVQAMPIITSIYSEATTVAAYSYIFTQRKLYNETAGAKGAFIVSTNSSFGPAGTAAQFPLWNALYDSMGTVGILSAGATSNDPNCNVDSCADIPSQCPSLYTIIATGTTQADVRHGAYGPHNVDLAAPGNGTYTINAGATWGGFGGTSAASPHVAGAVALLWAGACPKMLDDYAAHPDSLAQIMKGYLLNGVDTLSALAGKTVSGGRLNVYKSLNLVKSYDCITVVQPNGVATVAEDQIRLFPNPAQSYAVITPFEQIAEVSVYNDLGQRAEVPYQNGKLSIAALPQGIYNVAVTSQKGRATVKKLVKY